VTWVDRDDIRISFEDTGAGRCVVLGHSFLCSREMWARQAADLSESFRVINLDARGHGGSGPAEDPFTFDDLVDDVVTVLDHLGIERAVWGGLSLGGMTALRAAITVPDRVDALIVVDSSAGIDPLPVRVKYRLMASAARALGMRRLMPSVLPIMFGRTTLAQQPDLVAEWGERMASMHLASMLTCLDALNGREAMLDRLGDVDVPALVLVGEEDKAQPPSRSRAIADALPNAELVVIPEAGHLSALEQPEAVSQVMRDFLFDNFGGPES
jgi:3-oxoadipate enol-lactonase